MADVFDQAAKDTKPSGKQKTAQAAPSKGGDVFDQAAVATAPIQDQSIQQPGFWQSLGSDLGGLAMGALQIPQAMSAGPAGFLPQAANMAINDMQRGMEGRSTPYRAIAPVGEALGVNVRGMEESANQGDVGGVAGHAAAVPTAMIAGRLGGELPVGRLARAAGGGAIGAAEKLPIVGPMGKGAVRGFLKSWRASAPDVEIPPSKVSTTPPESVSKSSQLQQSKALQNVPVSAVQDKSAILSRLQQIAQQPGTGVNTPAPSGAPLRIAGQAVPADTNLAPALEKSLPQNRIQGKIMQVLRKEGSGSTVGIDRLMESPQLKGISREQVLNAAKSLKDQGKIWYEQTELALKAKQ